MFELHNIGDNSALAIGPRHRPALSDDLVLSVRHRTTGDGRSLLLSRAQTREVLDWLAAWYEHGWAGVPRQEGPTSADVIEHYDRIAVRERIRADHERIDAHRLLHAAIALVPAGCRSQDLDEVALAQARVWARIEKERDHLEQIRRTLVQGLHEIVHSTTPSADALRKAAARLLKVNKPWVGEVSDAEATDTPLYDRRRLVVAADLLPARD
ncbi:hypothetical protein [Phytohabitans aurantiacus]|uniref:Uncharacterized protein n=1 Tax=Phytohabitans aurantiacus TaxID=3016789 RepID=A0ABQ5RAD0_9ACTN|nr:hypothetical protein [Phytohabitans aurantiacus]GLI03709.1 hypothetical protein Pa4123_89880 [Phytohabitans aurantiacus]